MNEPTTDVLVARARLEPGARHNARVVGRWRTSSSALAIVAWPRAADSTPPVRQVMTISLGGAPGPNDRRA